MKHLAIAVATVLAGGLALNPAHATIFGPVGAQTQQADSGFELGGMETKQSYIEYPPPGVTAPNPLDTQTGTMPGIAIGYRRQDTHLGWGIIGHVSRGNTTYQGYTQNITTGALTPDTATTKNGFLGAHGWLDYGFAPSAIPHLSFTPGVLFGIHTWVRDNSQNPGGYTEDYANDYAALRLQTQYALGPVVFGATADIGRTFSSKMISGLDNETYQLGSGPWHKYGIKVTYNAFSAASVFVSYSRTTFQYGASSMHADGFMEPDSSTINTATEVGIQVR